MAIDRSDEYGFGDRVAIVTGGASGIGLAVATKLVARGARVAIWDLNEERLAARQKEFGEKVLSQRVDVAVGSQVEQACEAVAKRFGAPGYLVNNAGIIGRRMLISELDEKELDRVLAVNLKSVFLATSAFVRHSKGPNRAIVNMSSIAGRTGGMVGNMVYATTKGAIATLTVSLAKELAPDVRVNALAPGVIDTEIQGDVFGDKEAMNKMFAVIPLARAGQPEEVAEAAVWLLSSSAAYITGALLDVSGGR
jgi:3-oxoacyl-[acyl-carrier protein] reductase